METLRKMAELATNASKDEAFHQRLAFILAGAFVDSILSATYVYLTVDVVDQWIRGHFRYRGEHEEVLRTPDFMLDEIGTKGYFEGDCDDVSIMTAAILKTFGYRVRFVAIRYDSDQFQHVFVEVYSPDQARWVVLDATVQPGTEYKELERMVMPV